MREFKLNDEYTVVCEFVSTRSGFKHVAVLLKNGEEINRTKCCYINRTWERFAFQSVLCKIITENFKGKERLEYLDKLNANG